MRSKVIHSGAVCKQHGVRNTRLAPPCELHCLKVAKQNTNSEAQPESPAIERVKKHIKIRNKDFKGMPNNRCLLKFAVLLHSCSEAWVSIARARVLCKAVESIKTRAAVRSSVPGFVGRGAMRCESGILLKTRGWTRYGTNRRNPLCVQNT